MKILAKWFSSLEILKWLRSRKSDGYFRAHSDAWSQVQILSKLWAVEEIEKRPAILKKNPVIWILGGWYGLLPFLMFSRNHIQPSMVYSFDRDEEANQVAQLVNKTWSFNPLRFYTLTEDCEMMNYERVDVKRPDIIINTSTEHFSDSWMNNIPKDVIVVAQNTDMKHSDHINCANSVDSFADRFDSSFEIIFKGEKKFSYPGLEFSRFMIIGRKV